MFENGLTIDQKIEKIREEIKMLEELKAELVKKLEKLENLKLIEKGFIPKGY